MKKSQKRKNRDRMRKKYADPSNTTKAKIMEGSAYSRAEKYGCRINTDPSDLATRISMYHEVHQRNLRDGKRKWSVDHIVALSLGGPHCSSNMTIIPFADNLKKSVKERISVRPKQQPDDLITRSQDL